MLQALVARAAATLGRAVVAKAVEVAVKELQRPDAGAKLDDAVARGARALGRTVGTLRNR